MTITNCAIEGWGGICDTSKGCARGWCKKHYEYWRKHGDFEPRRQTIEDPATRFWSKVDVGSAEQCWPWMGTIIKGRGGYGQFTVRGKRFQAHRYAYELTYGPIADGLQIDHVRARGCTRTDCVNPRHLEPVTPWENLRRSSGLSAINSTKTHCLNGHEFSAENTKVANGKRQCRTCNRIRARTYRAAARQPETHREGLL